MTGRRIASPSCWRNLQQKTSLTAMKQVFSTAVYQITHVFKTENVQVEKVKRKIHCTRNCKHDWQKITSTGNWQGQESAASSTSKILPLDYDFNCKAWMTSTIVETYIQKLDRKFTQQKQKITLILDNLDSIKLVFLPPKHNCHLSANGCRCHLLSQSTLQEQLG